MKFSYPEARVYKFLISKGFKIIPHDRSKLINPKTKRRLELDFYLPDYHIGIEVQSKYHRYYKQKMRDAIKYSLCKQKNLPLIYIYAPVTYQKLNLLLNKINKIIDLKKV